MNWGHPNYIYLGVFLAVLVLAGSLAAWFQRKRVLALFVSQDRAKKLTSHMPTWEYCTRSVLIISAVILGSLALASPRWGYILEKSNATSLDIIIAVDTSRSMLAEDLSPNRMKRTQLAIQELMKLGQGDRFGLIPFAGSAFLQCPLTVDQEALRQHVNLINVDLIPNGGTNLGEAIKAASESFAEHEEDSHKVLVLFSDGEDHDPNALSVAEEASSEGMRIFTIGVGTSEGELIPVKYCPSCDSANTPTRSRCRICNAYLLRQQQFIRDEEGNVVRSRINEGMLEDIAESTGGFYLQLAGARTMAVLYKNGLAPLPKSENNSAMVRRQKERYQWPLTGAVLLLLVEMFWPRGRKPRGGTVTSTLALLCLLVLPTHADTLKQAKENYNRGEYALAQRDYEEILKLNPGDSKLHYNAGTAAYKTGKYNEAAKHFRSSLRTSDLEIQNSAFYNLGNTHYRLGSQMQRPEDQIPAWEEAARYFKAASQLNPEDDSSKRNLDFVRDKIEEAKRKLEQLSDELPLDGVTRFKNQEDKKFALRIFPPKRELIPDRPYWRMFTLDHYVHGVAKVSESLQARAKSNRIPLPEYGGREPIEEILPGQWRFRFEPLFSEFLPINGPFANAQVEDNSWKYNPVVLQAKLKSVPTQAVNYTVIDPTDSLRLAPSPLDDPLRPEKENDFTVEREEIYPFTTLALNLKNTEISKLFSALRDFTEDKQLPLATFNEACIQWLHKRHKYPRQTRIPEDKENDPVVRWMMSEEPGHCEYFAYSYVLLARSAGFPARIVCGFAGGEWDDKTQSWTNEQTDAHAWAEVFDGKQWLRVDPTPPEDGQGEGEEPQQNQNNGQGQNPDQQDGKGNPENPQNQQGENPNGEEPNEDRDEGELPEELLETLRQAQQLLDALKTDEKPLGSLEAKEGRLGRRIQRNKKDW
mgnify:FL=1